MIRAFLGPCKNNKVVIDGKDFHIVRCPYHLLKETITLDHFNFVIEDTLESHHKKYGCSTTTLLAMWYFWKEEFELLLHEGYEVSDIVTHSYDVLDTIVSHLHQIVLDLRTLIFPVSSTISSSIPKELCYRSRYFSPVNEENLLKDILIKKDLKSRIHAVVERLSHDDEENAKLVSDLWIQQISSTNDTKFCSEGTILCLLALPSSYSSIVEGCILKSKLLSWYDQDTKLESKSLIIKGSLTHEYVHLGGNSKVNTVIRKTPDKVTVTERDVWLKKCFSLLKRLHVDVLLVHGAVDDDLASYCLSNSICLLSHISWSVLEALCLATNISPCTYLLDCDEKNLVTCLEIKMWKPSHHLTSIDEKFILVRVAASFQSVKLYTLVLCHPNPSYLSCLEHQLMHLMSRLSLVTESNNLLPGSGKTEEWCRNLVRRFAVGSGVKAKVSSAIAIGFNKYFEFVSKKLELKGSYTNEDGAYDEMESKVQAWKAALCMVNTALQCDTILINEPGNSASINSGLFGYL